MTWRKTLIFAGCAHASKNFSCYQQHGWHSLCSRMLLTNVWSPVQRAHSMGGWQIYYSHYGTMKTEENSAQIWRILGSQAHIQLFFLSASLGIWALLACSALMLYFHKQQYLSYPMFSQDYIEVNYIALAAVHRKLCSYLPTTCFADLSYPSPYIIKCAQLLQEFLLNGPSVDSEKEGKPEWRTNILALPKRTWHCRRVQYGHFRQQ